MTIVCLLSGLAMDNATALREQWNQLDVGRICWWSTSMCGIVIEDMGIKLEMRPGSRRKAVSQMLAEFILEAMTIPGTDIAGRSTNLLYCLLGFPAFSRATSVSSSLLLKY